MLVILARLALEAALGEPLPASALPGYDYTGEDRLFLTTPRQQAEKHQPLHVRAFLLTKTPPVPTPGNVYVIQTLQFTPVLEFIYDICITVLAGVL